ncbi:MAG TPA: LPS export ABC transporter periplasmic protein LptC, partial [Verrucomicrobiae bacterium]|nr:LPS export ABC transporter periplasmic protein LptC [Verrucomicrobiae bacterium]
SAQRTDLTNPVVTFYRDGAATSRLRAPSGSIDMKTHDVDTWGGVQVVTTDSTTLTTDKLRYDAQTRKISSKDHVTLDKPDSITEGEGLMTDPELHDVTIGHQTVRMKHAARK